MGGIAVAQHMRGDVLVNARIFRRPLHNFSYGGRAVLVALLSFKQVGSRLVKVDVFLEQRIDALGQGQQPFFAPFPLSNMKRTPF